jgi:AcrR family transcriptional regulator
MEEHLMQVAQSLLDEVGHIFTMEQLEARAEVSRATIYRHIGSKRKLLERLAHERGETFEVTDRRQSILDAARTVFGRKGMTATTMEQIAQEAGVGVATVYRHFGDKRSLIRAFSEEMTPRPAIRDRALNPTEDVVADLEEIVSSALPFFSENRDVLRLVFMGSESDGRYLKSLRQGSDSTLAYLSGYFQTQLNTGRLDTICQPDELALALMGMMLAFAVIGPLHYGKTLDHPQNCSKLIVNLFLNDLRGSSS